jgi:hypothetical protein
MKKQKKRKKEEHTMRIATKDDNDNRWDTGDDD